MENRLKDRDLIPQTTITYTTVYSFRSVHEPLELLCSPDHLNKDTYRIDAHAHVNFQTECLVSRVINSLSQILFTYLARKTSSTERKHGTG